MATPSSTRNPPLATSQALPPAVSLSTRAPATAASLGETSTAELVRSTLEESKELVRVELQLFEQEVREDIRRYKAVSVMFGVALVLGLLTLATLVVALVIALGGSTGAALGISCVLAALAVILAAVAYKVFPGAPLERTRARLKQDMQEIKEHVS